MKMSNHEYEVLYRIIDDLTDDDLSDFVSDCRQHGGKKTAAYAAACSRGRRDYDAKVAKMYLAEDFSGV